MAQYWIPPNNKPATVAPSLSNYRRGVGTDTTALSPVQTRSDSTGPPYPYNTKAEPGNPTVIPADLLATYHFTFLIRHPKYSIPSYYRCTIPPLDEMTGFYNFRPDEAGYEELRILFDYLRSVGQIGPKFAGKSEANGEVNGHSEGVEICVVDADDLLDNPSGMIETYCKSTGIKWEPEMLVWDTEEDQARAKVAFEKWKGFHEDALDSDRLRPRTHVRATPIPMSECTMTDFCNRRRCPRATSSCLRSGLRSTARRARRLFGILLPPTSGITST